MKVSTATEAIVFLETAINELPEELKSAEWQWCISPFATDEEHLDNHRQSLEKTRAAFQSPKLTEMCFVATEDDLLLALCGNSPSAHLRARFVAWASPRNVSLLIARIKELEGNKDV